MSSWPNEQGFDNNYEQPTPVTLTVKGKIPSYAAGVLYRTGPLGYKVKTDDGKIWSAKHWFDGLSCVHRFQIDCPDNGPAEVTYQSRRTVDEYLEMVRKTGRLDSISFGAKRDPCQSIFGKFMSMFNAKRSSKNVGVTLSINMPGGGYLKDGAPIVRNDNVTHKSGIQTLHAKTDTPMFKKIDPVTLEPLGIALQDSLHPELNGQMSASHAKTDPKTGDFYNFNLKLGGKFGTYRVFCTSASTGETSILATFAGKPAYLHSIFLTESFVIICVWNSHITYGGLSVMYHKNICDAIAPFDPSQKAMWYVVDRLDGRGLVATYESDPFFCFHTINAWEEPSSSDPSKIDIVTELSAYENTDVIHRYYYDNCLSSLSETSNYAGKKRQTCLPQHTQFRLPNVNSGIDELTVQSAEVVFRAPKMMSMELPTINPAYLTRRHRYAYGNSDRLKSAFLDGIVKFDNVTQTSMHWEKEAHTPGECIFVADPKGKAEDDGVLLSVVLDGIAGRSYLLCLDARNLQEVGRAEMDGPMSFSFHGAHKAYGTKKHTGDY